MFSNSTARFILPLVGWHCLSTHHVVHVMMGREENGEKPLPSFLLTVRSGIEARWEESTHSAIMPPVNCEITEQSSIVNLPQKVFGYLIWVFPLNI